MRDTQFFVVKKLIDRYITHHDEGEWRGRAYPLVILQTSNAGLRKRVAEYIESLIENGYIDKDKIYISIGLLLDNL